MASNHHTNLSNPDYKIVKHIMIDIEDFKQPEDLNATKCSIYKVPPVFRTLKEPESAYTPQLVSIGPLHYGQKELEPMQKHKLRYLDLFRGRVKNNIKPLEEFKNYLRSKEDNIRQCYAEMPDIDDEKLVEMMFLDSVFIMELFLRVQRKKSEDRAVKKSEYSVEKKSEDSVENQTYSDDIILKQSWLNKSIQRDLLLLENQIPLFILEELYKFVLASDPAEKKHPTFADLARDYFDSFRTYKNRDEETGGFEKKDSCGSLHSRMKNCCTFVKGDSCSSKETGSSEPKHFTDLIRSFYITTYICERFQVSDAIKGPSLRTATELRESEGRSTLRTATKLRESGVSFEKVKNRPLLDIKFDRKPILSWFLCFGCFPYSSYFKARLQIPQLKVNYTTECVLRNLIAFEQCHYPDKPYICNYVSFIDSLIHTKDDVELLVEKEVIMHELGSDKEVATLVNGLCKHVVADETCYKNDIKDLNDHYQRQWNRNMASLRLVYFRDAWRTSSTLVATAVLVFTIFNFCRVVKLVLDLEGGYKKP